MALSDRQIDEVVNILKSIKGDHAILIAVMVDKEKRHKSNKVK